MNGLPHIYYTNVDRKIDRKKYMESQFDSLGLSYTRIEMLSCPKDGPPKDFLNNLVKTKNHYVYEQYLKVV